MGLDAAADVQDNLHQAAVVPPGGHGVHQKGKVAALGQVLVALVHYIVEGAEHEYTGFSLVTEAEIRVDIQQMAALAEEFYAEGVNGGDVRLIDQGILAAEAAVTRVFRCINGELIHNAGAQFCGGGIRKRYHQEAVNIYALPCHPRQQALHQYSGLARARCRRNQQATASVFYCGFLLTC